VPTGDCATGRAPPARPGCPVLSPVIEPTGGRFQFIVGIVTGWLIVRQWRRLRTRAGQTAAPAIGDRPTTYHPRRLPASVTTSCDRPRG
jgi:hypothetical protein